MLDIQQLRSNLDAVALGLAKRGKPIDFSEFTALETERKTLQTRTQELQAQRNSLSKQIGMLKGQGKDASEVMAQVGALGDELKASEARLEEIRGKHHRIFCDPAYAASADYRQFWARLAKGEVFSGEYAYAQY